MEPPMEQRNSKAEEDLFALRKAYAEKVFYLFTNVTMDSLLFNLALQLGINNGGVCITAIFHSEDECEQVIAELHERYNKEYAKIDGPSKQTIYKGLVVPFEEGSAVQLVIDKLSRRGISFTRVYCGMSSRYQIPQGTVCSNEIYHETFLKCFLFHHTLLVKLAESANTSSNCKILLLDEDATDAVAVERRQSTSITLVEQYDDNVSKANSVTVFEALDSQWDSEAGGDKQQVGVQKVAHEVSKALIYLWASAFLRRLARERPQIQVNVISPQMPSSACLPILLKYCQEPHLFEAHISHEINDGTFIPYSCHRKDNTLSEETWTAISMRAQVNLKELNRGKQTGSPQSANRRDSSRSKRGNRRSLSALALRLYRGKNHSG